MRLTKNLLNSSKIYDTETQRQQIIKKLKSTIQIPALEQALTTPTDKLTEPDLIQLGFYKKLLLSDYKSFIEFVHPLAFGTDWETGEHHDYMIKEAQLIFDGQTMKEIISVPPRHSKSLLFTTYFSVYGMVLNPVGCSNVVLSFNNNFLKVEGSRALKIIKHSFFKRVFNVELEKKSYKHFDFSSGASTIFENINGQVTGLGIGDPTDNYAGALIIDDPVNVKNIKSRELQKVNQLVTNAILPRMNNITKTPILVLAQRLAPKDLPGYLLQGGSGHKWKHLMLPAIIQTEKPYPLEYTHGEPVSYKLPKGALWDYMMPLEELHLMEQTNPYKFSTQYMQYPKVQNGTIFTHDHIHYYEQNELPEHEIQYTVIFADTAVKTEDRHDYSVFVCVAVTNYAIYIIDLLRGKWEADQLQKQLVDFYRKHNRVNLSRNNENSYTLKYAGIEDKQSGSGLIQRAKAMGGMRIKSIQRSRGKAERAIDCAPEMFAERVQFPKNAHFVESLVDEFLSFNLEETHDFDDQVDAVMSAIEIEVIQKHTSTRRVFRYDPDDI